MIKIDKQFANWAPAEGNRLCTGYNEEIIKKTFPPQ